MPHNIHIDTETGKASMMYVDVGARCLDLFLHAMGLASCSAFTTSLMSTKTARHSTVASVIVRIDDFCPHVVATQQATQDGTRRRCQFAIDWCLDAKSSNIYKVHLKDHLDGF